MNPYYTDYSEYIARIFPGRKIQKISVNAGFSCPNRDGTIGRGGCIYCANTSFTPGYCFDSASVSDQLKAGISFFGRKYPKMEYMAYFQSYTNTYGRSADALEKLWQEALRVPGVVALAVGTRPDCLSESVVDMFGKINKEVPVFVELGVETMSDETLALINRGHSSAQTVDALMRLADAGIHAGAHLIAGLPGETSTDVLESVKVVCNLPIDSIKMHHLQVLRGTRLHRMIMEGEITVPQLTVDSYLDLCCDIIRIVPRRIAIERFLASAPPGMVVSPAWGLKNYQFVNLLHNKLKGHSTNQL